MKETLEEVLPKNSNGKYSRNEIEKAFESGAEWQAERMYTYDELRQIAYNAYCKGQLDNNPTEGKFNLWIQEIKKKS